MNDDFLKDYPELQGLYKKYSAEPNGHVFAPFADACRKAGLYEKAIEVCERGLEKNPNYPSGHVVQGKCLHEMGDVDKAERSFLKVLSLDENNLVALKYLGMILVERGQESAAREKFKHILALDPDNREIKGKLEELHERDDDSPVGDEPTIELREVTDKGFEGAHISLGDAGDTSDELATMTLADIYASQGYADKAARIYRELLAVQPHNDDLKRKLLKVDKSRQPFSEDDDNQQDSARSAAADADQEPATVTMPLTESTEEPATVTTPPTESTEEPATVTTPPTESTEEPADDASAPEPSPVSVRDGDLDDNSYDHFKRWLRNMSD